jgi:hypothetical protein
MSSEESAIFVENLAQMAPKICRQIDGQGVRVDVYEYFSLPKTLESCSWPMGKTYICDAKRQKQKTLSELWIKCFFS